jgi:hypothetical protein
VGRTQQPTTKLTVAEILKRSAAQYVAKHSSQAVPQVQSTLAKLSLCRTAALGGHVYRCPGCPHEVVVHNSCGDRYCPTCSGARRRDWLDSTGELIFDGVDHFQVVFTLPDELSRLALGNRNEIYNLLFASAWSALKGLSEGRTVLRFVNVIAAGCTAEIGIESGKVAIDADSVIFRLTS